MICARCDKAIRPGQPYTHHVKDSGSVAGATVYLHVASCRRVPIQTSQDSIRH